jgi:NAD(P)-dependent dehydrogenase (short-subunit alcohol dehydrogenase family)
VHESLREGVEVGGILARIVRRRVGRASGRPATVAAAPMSLTERFVAHRIRITGQTLHVDGGAFSG